MSIESERRDAPRPGTRARAVMRRDGVPRPGLRMQQQAMVQLIVAGVLMAGLCVGAALLYAYGFGHRNVRSVAPVLVAFMRAGAEGNVFQGHRLLSVDGMGDVSRDDLAAIYAQRHLFDGFDRVHVTSADFSSLDRTVGNETAVVGADVFYLNRPPARLEATMEYEPNGWRIRSFQMDGGDS